MGIQWWPVIALTKGKVCGKVSHNMLRRHHKIFFTLQLCHDEHDGVSNHRLPGCLLNHLFGRRSKKALKLLVIGLCEGNSPVTDEFPAQRASNAENASIWWRHHVQRNTCPYTTCAVPLHQYLPALLCTNQLMHVSTSICQICCLHNGSCTEVCLQLYVVLMLHQVEIPKDYFPHYWHLVQHSFWSRVRRCTGIECYCCVRRHRSLTVLFDKLHKIFSWTWMVRHSYGSALVMLTFCNVVMTKYHPLLFTVTYLPFN